MESEFSPDHEIENQKPVLICCGDSITRGQFSYDWVSHLKNLFKNKAKVINEGYNSYTVSNFIDKKIQGVLDQKPTDIIISLGTNDANAQWRFPNDPQYSEENFRNNLTKLINIIKANSKAKTALTTIPNIGENPDHSVYKIGLKYNEIIKEVAEKEQVELLPVFEMIQKEYQESDKKPKPKFDHTKKGEMLSMANNIFRRHILKQDYEKIAANAGYVKKIDELHQNKSAKVFAACASWFFKKNHPSLAL